MIDSNNINVMREKLRKIGRGNGDVQEEIERIDNLIGSSPIPGTQRTITSSLNYLYDRRATDYSSNEINTGLKWIDNSDIYKKTIHIEQNIATSWNTILEDNSISLVIDGIFSRTDSNMVVGGSFRFEDDQVKFNPMFAVGNCTAEVTIYYTKNE